MPTLPGRETSILGALANNAASHSATASDSPATEEAGPAFDWAALVRKQRPGRETEQQRAQAARFGRIRQDVQRWADALGVAHEHLEESSFYATVCLPPSARHEQAVALALVVYWIYLLDDFLDRRDFASLAQQPENEARAAIGRSLDAILRPLARDDVRVDESSVQTGRHSPARPRDPLEDTCSDPEPECATLRAALSSVLGALEAQWALLPQAARRWPFRRRLIAQQFHACAAAMQREILWNAVLARSPEHPALPPFATYLQNGAVSIGMPAVAAVAASFEVRPQHAWRDGRAAVLVGGQVVRLTNDLHTYFADVEEGKVSAITLRLGELGYPAKGLDPETSDEVRQAQASVGAELTRAVADFARLRVALPDGPLSHCVSHAVAFALAVYGDGSKYLSQPRPAA